MRNYFLILILTVSCDISFAQVQDLCHPEFAKKIADEVIFELSDKEKKNILESELTNRRERRNCIEIIALHSRILNYEDFIPIINYLKIKTNLKPREYELGNVFSEYTFRKIRNEDQCLEAIIDSRFKLNLSPEESSLRNDKKDTINGTYIPMNIEDAISQLDFMLPEDFKVKAREMEENDFRARAHSSFGLTHIRNGWELYNDSRLYWYFRNLGIDYVDDMSGLVVVSYYRHLNNLDIRLEQQIESTLKSRRKYAHEKKENFPEYVKDVDWAGSFEYDNEAKEEQLIAFYRDIDWNVQWMYSSQYGWRKSNNKIAKRLNTSKNLFKRLDKYFKEK